MLIRHSLCTCWTEIKQKQANKTKPFSFTENSRHDQVDSSLIFATLSSSALLKHSGWQHDVRLLSSGHIWTHIRRCKGRVYLLGVVQSASALSALMRHSAGRRWLKQTGADKLFPLSLSCFTSILEYPRDKLEELTLVKSRPHPFTFPYFLCVRWELEGHLDHKSAKITYHKSLS